MTADTSLTAATEAFLASADEWLTEEDAPAVHLLLGLAREIDVKLTAALASTYRHTYNMLNARRPATPSPTDPVADLIGRARAA